MAETDFHAPSRFPDRTATIWEHCRNGTDIPVPMIRLSGMWIEQAGFEPAHRIRIEVSPGRLVITPIDEAELDPTIHGVPTRVEETGLRRRIKLPGRPGGVKARMRPK